MNDTLEHKQHPESSCKGCELDLAVAYLHEGNALISQVVVAQTESLQR